MERLPGLDAAVAELYGLDPGDFVARRDELAKQARTAKDRPLANAIKALRRPTVGAWYVNVAARANLLALKELLELGRTLRAAQAAQDFQQVVALGPRRAELERRVLADLTAHLAQLGITATPAALEEVRSTLRATLADTEAADAVASGHLDRPLAYGDLGDGLTAALSAMTGKPAPAPAAAPEDIDEGPDAGGEEGPEAEVEPGPEVVADPVVRSAPDPDETRGGPDPDAEATDPSDDPADDELARLEEQARAAEEALRASQAALAALQAQRDELKARRGRQAAERRLAEAQQARAAAQESRDALADQLAEADTALADADAAVAAAEAELARLS